MLVAILIGGGVGMAVYAVLRFGMSLPVHNHQPDLWGRW